MMNNEVVVIGGCHHNTLGVLRSLGIARVKNILLILVGDGLDFISCTKYVRSDNIIKLTSDGELYESLLKMGPSFSSKPVVICSSDSSVATIDEHYDSLNPFYFLPNAKKKQGEINKLMDKCRQNEIAEQCGLLLPETKQGRSVEEIETWNAYPCIIKPIESILGSKADIKLCYSKEELIANIITYNGRPFFIQRFVEKEMEFQFIGCSLDNGEKVIVPGFTKLIRQPLNTNTGYLKYVDIKKFDNKVLVQKVCDFVRNIGYEGLFSVEFLRDKSGKDFFLEINMRNDGNSYCVTASGVNLPYNWYLYKTNQVLGNITLRREVLFMPELEDLKLCIKMKYNLFKWLKQFFFASHAVFFWRDPLPFYRKCFPSLVHFVVKIPLKIVGVFSK